MTTHAPGTHTHHQAPAPERPAAARALAIVFALTAMLAVLTLAFALPAAKSGPHEVPIGVAGPQAAAGQAAQALDQKAPGAFAVTTYLDAEALHDAILDREVYGGVSIGPGGPTLYTATGGSPAVAQLLTQVGTGIAQQTGMPLQTRELAPLSAQDPRGVGMAAAALPITMASIVPAFALVLAIKNKVWTRFTAAVLFSGLIGITVTGLLWSPLGSIDHNFWVTAGGMTLGVAGGLLFMLGLGSLFGKVGLGIGAALAMLIGNPLSGLASAPEMLPAGWGTLGQLMPQGATATLLRSCAYFGGSGATQAVVVLSCWAIAGTVLVGIAARRRT